MPSLKEDLATLKAEIQTAFAGARFPGDRPEDLVEISTPSESDRLAPLFAGKKWEDWVDNPLGMFAPYPFCGGLSFMDPEAFRYYLPVLLLACTVQRNQCPNLDDELVRILIRPKDEYRQHWYGWAIGKLTKPQLLAVLQALDFIDKYGGPSGSAGEEFHAEIVRVRFSLSYYLTSHDKPG